ncbi:MAG: ACP S-malonyltransferase [Candidatus Marinimicrobia bacterium]|nr:ACP S-malonyltransferase [Candidatus Neomarinimicrobiota bacterium]MCF7850871.1 ACP S-malonyltransferase [Candidatus Neomarinimicrobiota bacterium]MCF7904386.1 ACP S-malonyltransferase [Candidatus Neomarinimicrobiota bacterium]
MKRALVFPGQGSQFVGMGQDIFDTSQVVQEMYAKASDILGYDIADVTFNGPLEALTETRVTQPALFITSAACFSLIPDGFEFQLVAGHSLGEYSALFAAGVLNFVDALSIVKVRAEGMQAASQVQKGSMAAVLNLSRKDVEKVCQQASETGIVQAANFNSPGQIVISGEEAAVHKAMELAKALGARKVVELNVSGAFHSPLMAPATEALRAAIAKATFNSAKVPVVANVDAAATTDPQTIQANLIQQLESPVLWEDSVETMLNNGITEFLEVGPGRVLQGLIRRIERGAGVAGISTREQLETLL